MTEKLDLLFDLIIELLSNGNAAGEYDENDPRLKDCLYDDKILRLAKEVTKRFS